MNAKTLFASALLLVAAGSSFAADNNNDAAVDQAFRQQAAATSTLTREQVRAATIAARQAGQLDTNEAYQDIAYMAPRPKGADVKAQLAAHQPANKAAKDNTAQ